MKSAVFIKSYEGDFPWLDFALRSCRKFASGFNDIVLAIPEGQSFQREGVRTVHVREPTDCDHYLFQQCVKMHADALTDCDVILMSDSDTIFTQRVTPETYFIGDKIAWLVTPWEKTETPWRPMVEKFMGQTVEFEYMRRHPTVAPRWLLSDMRAFCVKQHGMSLYQYVMSQPRHEWSEFNCLGAFAYAFHRDKFYWINTDTHPDEIPPLTVLQKFSWGGLTDEIRAEFETILSGAGEPTADAADSDPPAQPSTDAEWEAVKREIYGWIPWESKEQSVATIQKLASALQKFCTGGAKTRRVREELHKLGIVELPYRFKKRRKWRKRKAKA